MNFSNDYKTCTKETYRAVDRVIAKVISSGLMDKESADLYRQVILMWVNELHPTTSEIEQCLKKLSETCDNTIICARFSESQEVIDELL